jgi:type VI secretion system secreted protein VgrG
MNDVLNQTSAQYFSIASATPADSPPALFLHCALFVTSTLTVSDETFRLESFKGQDSVSELFDYQLELNGNSALQGGVNYTFSDMIGCAVTVGIACPDIGSALGAAAVTFQQAITGTACGAELALLNGIVTSFSVKNQGQYQITMKPALYKLTLTNHYRIFHACNVCDVITQLLGAYNISFSLDSLTGSQNLAVIRTQDWLQAGESDFEFLKRVIAKACLFYYFTHTGNSHTVVFSNQAAYPSVFADGTPMRYNFTSADQLGLVESDVISDYCYTEDLNSSSVQGLLVQQDGSWQNNTIVQYQPFPTQAASNAGELPFNQCKVFQYGGSNDEVADLTAAAASALNATSSQLSGSSYCAHFLTGYQFMLSSGSSINSTVNPLQSALEQRLFVLTQVSHQANADGSYQNQFQACNAAFLISRFSLEATQQRTLLATVVSTASTAGQDPSMYGAPSSFDPESSQFSDTMNPTPACAQVGVFVRFSTSAVTDPAVWVKLSASMQTVPTVGAIVQVGRADDESELPEIQNVIQSNGSMLVVPDGWLANTHVGSSYSTSYGDNKTIGYGTYSIANLQQASGIVNTAFDTGKFSDSRFTQGASYSFSCAESLAPGASSNTSQLYGSDPVAGDILSASESFGSTYSRQQAAVTRNYSTVGSAYSNSSTDTNESIAYIGSNTTTTTGDTSINTTTTNVTTNISNTGVTTNITTSGVTSNVTTTGNITDVTTNGNVISTTTSGNVVNTTTAAAMTNITTSAITTNITDSGITTNTTTSGVTTNTTTSGDTSNTTTTGNVTDVTTNGNITSQTTCGIKTESVTCGGVTTNYVNGAVVNNNSSGDTTNIVTTGSVSDVITSGDANVIETAGAGAKVTTLDAQPHVDNIISRTVMVEALYTFL